ncbi:Hypothetical predicted protein [Xyrichtys novacula]|uniref:Uncharacterized protein n=1 Tax=Xyrichtys novacula TaxID=13765 RepID=A0AAV1G1U0_XYRNO|nr:Hypothetical predicted protein [Xyrichtys novacula]
MTEAEQEVKQQSEELSVRIEERAGEGGKQSMERSEGEEDPNLDPLTSPRSLARSLACSPPWTLSSCVKVIKVQKFPSNLLQGGIRLRWDLLSVAVPHRWMCDHLQSSTVDQGAEPRLRLTAAVSQRAKPENGEVRTLRQHEHLDLTSLPINLETESI